MSKERPLNEVDQALQTLQKGLYQATPDQLVRLDQLAQEARRVRGDTGRSLASNDPFRAPVVQTAETREYHGLIDKLQLEALFGLEQRRYEFFGLDSLVEQPVTFDQVLKVLSPDRLRMAVKEDLKDPRLIVLEKGISLKDARKPYTAKNGFENHFYHDYNDDYDDEIRPNASYVYLIDGLAEMDLFEWDNGLDEIEHRLRNFHAYKKRRCGGMDRQKGFHFLMQSQFENRKVDEKNPTILDEERPTDHRYPTVPVLGNKYSLNHESFSFCHLHRILPDCHFRRSIGGLIRNRWISSVHLALSKIGL